MQKTVSLSVFILGLFFFSLLNAESGLQAQDSLIIPGPEPFSVDAESAVYCIDLLETVRFIEHHNQDDKAGIMEVRTVWSLFLEWDESFPEGHRRRYDIIVNGAPLDWDNSYIEYGGAMLNLRLLFLYRNQYPPQGWKSSP